MPVERGRAWDEAVDLFVEAIDLLEHRQREAELRAQEDVRRAELRASQAERRQAQLERALAEMRGQVELLSEQMELLRQTPVAPAAVVEEPTVEPQRSRFRSVLDRLGGPGSNVLGLTLIGLGVVAIFGTVVWQVSMVLSGAYVVPPPAALATVAPAVSAAAPPPTPQPTSLPRPTSVPTAVPVEVVATVAPTSVVEEPSQQAAEPVAPPVEEDGGYAVRLAIPAIDLDTAVKQAGLKQIGPMAWEWETLPFVAAHYGDLTARVGAVGNAVISGHVVTLNDGNVFRDLHRVSPGDAIGVWDDRGSVHLYRVTSLRLVPPTDPSPMQSSEHSTLTLITCGGRFDFMRREFSDRLIVEAEMLA